MDDVGVDLSIIIVNWNTCDLLRDCLASIHSKPCRTEFEVYVVDNASSDDSVSMTRRDFPGVNVIESGGNLGYARGNNLAMRVSRGRDVLLLNSDTVIDPDVLPATIDLLHGDPSIGVLGCALVGLDGVRQNSAGYRYPSGPWVGGPKQMLGDGLIECAHVWGAYQLVRREVIEQVGMLDEDFFMFYEDVDWCWKIHEAGWKIAYDPNHSIVHIARASCKRAPSTDHQRRMITSEALLFAKHHGPNQYASWRRRRLVHYGWCVATYWLRSKISRSGKVAVKLGKHLSSYRTAKALADPWAGVFRP